MATQPLTTSGAHPPVISINSDGAAIVAWSERVGGTNNSNNQQVAARVRDASGTWLPVQVMHAGDDANDRHPVVVMSNAGEAFVVWEQTAGAAATSWNSIWYRRFSAGAWGAEATLETYDMQASHAPAIAANGAGVVVVTYLQRLASGTATQLLSQRYAGSGWDAPQVAGQAPEIDASVPPSVTLDDNGVATAAWNAGNAQGVYNVQVNMTSPGSGAWAANPTPMETDDLAKFDNMLGTLAGATMPVVRGDGRGTVFLVWRKRVTNVGRFDVYASRYAAGAWEAPALIESHDTNTAYNPALGVNGSGVAAAAWYYGVELDVWTNVWR
jgi:hypothetical protein